MRKSNKEIKDRAVIEEILSKSLICRIAISDADYPYIVPMNYGYSDNALYFHCATEGRKIDLIRKNNRVGFEIEDDYEIVKSDISCKWTTKYRSIIGYGDIEIISDHEEKKQGLDILMKHHGRNDNEYDDRIVEKVLILKLEIKNLTAKQG